MDSPTISDAGAHYNALSAREGWSGICDPTLAFHHPQLAVILAIWREKAGVRGIPMRKDLTPKILKAHLPHIAIYERVTAESGAHRYRVRLMGTQFSQIMTNLTGKFIDDAVPPQFLLRWNAALDAALDAGVPLRFVSRSETVGKPFIAGEYFEAPLLADDGSMSLVFAAGIFAAAKTMPELANHRLSRADLHG